jgi:hypothetical protein
VTEGAAAGHRTSAAWRAAVEGAAAASRAGLPRLAHLAEDAAACLALHHRHASDPPGEELARQAELAALRLEAAVEAETLRAAVPAEVLAPLRAAAALLLGRPAPAGTPPPAARPGARGPAGAAPAPVPATAPGPSRRPPPAPPRPRDRLLVDGCNFLGRASGYRLGEEESRDRLLFRLQEYARHHPAHHVAVVFDGQKTARRSVGGVEEHVTGGGPADEVLLELMRRLPEAERPRCTLITDDRELARRAADLGVRREPVAWLRSRLEQRPTAAAGEIRREGGLSAAQVAEWEQYFDRPPDRPGRH